MKFCLLIFWCTILNTSRLFRHESTLNIEIYECNPYISPNFSYYFLLYLNYLLIICLFSYLVTVFTFVYQHFVLSVFNQNIFIIIFTIWDLSDQLFIMFNVYNYYFLPYNDSTMSGILLLFQVQYLLKYDYLSYCTSRVP